MIERGVTRQITVTRGNFNVIASSIPFTASKAKFTFRAYPRRESGRRKYIARAQWRNNSPGDTSYVILSIYPHMSQRSVCWHALFLRIFSFTSSLVRDYYGAIKFAITLRSRKCMINLSASYGNM